MLLKTEGLVIKTVKFQETSLIVKIFTERHGLLSFLVNGVRTTKAQNKAALFQPLTFLDLIIYYRDNKNLLRLKEYKNAYVYQSLPFDIVKSSAAQVILEVVDKCIREEEENSELYAFLKHTFTVADTLEKLPPNFLLNFLIDFAYFTGIQPNGRFNDETPYFDLREGTFTAKDIHHEYSVNAGNSALISGLLDGENPVLTKSKRRELLHIMVKYYQMHIDGFKELKSLRIFEEIF